MQMMSLRIEDVYGGVIAARQREAAAYNRFKKFFTDRQNRYYGCPSCGQTVRVPRKKGRISIKCPRCGQRFEKKT